MRLKTGKLVLLIAFVLQTAYSGAQPTGIKFVRNKDKSVTFSYYKNTPGSVFVVFKLTDLKNTTEGVIKTSVYGHGGRLTTLYPTYKNERIGFSYSPKTIKTFWGDIDAKPDLDFKYILPLKSTSKVEVVDLDWKFNKEPRPNYKGRVWYEFEALPNDTVLAVRKGIVVSLEKGERLINLKTQGLKKTQSSIIVEHEDGTMAKYKFLMFDEFKVSLGDVVYPSTPLAVINVGANQQKAQLHFSIGHLKKSAKDIDYFKDKYQGEHVIYDIFNYVNALFYVNDNQVLKLETDKSYSTFYNNDIVTLEMTKREKKRWKKRKLLVK